MKLNRIGRIVVCLLLICCLTFHAMIPRAEASSIGAAATIVKASTVTCNPYIIAGAILIALGVYAGVDSGAFETVANNCVDAMEAAGTWIKDGVTELLRTEDTDGNASYYVDSGLMEDVRSWAISDGCVSSPFLSVSSFLSEAYTTAFADYCSLYGVNSAYCIISDNTTANDQIHFSLYLPVLKSGRYTCYDADGQESYFKSYVLRSGSSWERTAGGTSPWPGNAGTYVFHTSSPYIASSEISLGVFPSVPVDGTSARQWSEGYTDRGLKVYGGGSGNNNNDGKWFWPLALTLTAADLYAMSQADQWAAQTPAEFEDYTEVEELEIVSRPEVDFAQGVELAPVTSSAPDSGGDTGFDTGTESGNQTDYTSWFQKIIKGIEELPSKFESWISDCKTAIEELPSKFADWFNSIIEKLSSIWETLKSIPQTILDGLRNILTELFVPQEDYLTDKLTSLRERFSFVDSIIDTGKAIGNALVTGSAEPPVIYIHLEDTEGKYNIGGTTPFLDMRWYARYKPVGDQLLSSLIWIFFVWRCFVHAPNIISGIAGDVENLNMPDGGGMYLSGSHSPFDGGPYEKPKRGRFERRPKRRR